ncbi:F-box only protein 44-like isoform X2 [Crotalus tigris]|uniref:F-box only protein 44-like isoform X2 n=1 Tax=Crotalus tigris TaxID=88082 RepID=UPI00192F67C3|nr:F-box only protein 44-like isoform X2 [Crotalus tigris]
MTHTPPGHALHAAGRSSSDAPPPGPLPSSSHLETPQKVSSLPGLHLPPLPATCGLRRAERSDAREKPGQRTRKSGKRRAPLPFRSSASPPATFHFRFRLGAVRGASAALLAASMETLPEDALLAVLVLVPARDLVLCCRLVCSLWRGLVDLPSLWRLKCQREGYRPEPLDSHVPDWRDFYFLCSLKKNLIKNPWAEEGFEHWQKELNGGSGWKIEQLPGDHGRNFPLPHVQKYFVTSYGSCMKRQLITLRDEGYWDQLMDDARPDIVVRCAFRLRLSVPNLRETPVQRLYCSPGVSAGKGGDRTVE